MFMEKKFLKFEKNRGFELCLKVTYNSTKDFLEAAKMLREYDKKYDVKENREKGGKRRGEPLSKRRQALKSSR